MFKHEDPSSLGGGGRKPGRKRDRFPHHFGGKGQSEEETSSSGGGGRKPGRRRDRFLRLFGGKGQSEEETVVTQDGSQDELRGPSPAVPDTASKASPVIQPPDPTPHQEQITRVIEPPDDHDRTNVQDGTQSEDLWAHAYAALKLRNPDLVAAYWDFLPSTDIGHTNSTQPSLTSELVDKIAKSKLDDREAEQWVIKLWGKPIKVREHGEDVVKFILRSNQFISAAVSTQPYAALAWTGVSVLLPLLLNSSQQTQAMIDGLKRVCDLLSLYKYKEEVYLQRAETPPRPDFVKAIEEVYTDIYEYQACFVCHLSKSSSSRAVRGTLKLDDWEKMLENIESSNKRCEQYLNVSNEEEVRRRFMEESYQTQKSIDIQQRILDMLTDSQSLRQKELKDDKETALLGALASNYKGDKDSIARRVPGTCEWFFEDERFQQWRDSKVSSLLWVSAGPGCGKSVLSRALVDEGRVRTNAMSSTVCYFFFKDAQDQRTRAADALSAILHQLFEHTSLIKHALESHKDATTLRQNWELWDLLCKCAKDAEAGQIICIVDALDECEENERNFLMDKLIEFFSCADEHTHPSVALKFLVTSRPYENIEYRFQKLQSVSTYMRFDGDDKSSRIGEEINLVIDARIPLLTQGFNDKDSKLISDQLKQMENRTYLWLYLMMGIIEQSRSLYGRKCDIEALISDLPATITQQYEKILERSTGDEKARILLQLVVAATRPLSLHEANIAMVLATQKGTSNCTSQSELDLWPQEYFKSVVTNWCGLFVSIHDGKISLLHQTAREFLTLSPKSGSTNPGPWQGSLNLAEAHSMMFKLCDRGMNFDVFASVHGKYIEKKFTIRIGSSDEESDSDRGFASVHNKHINEEFHASRYEISDEESDSDRVSISTPGIYSLLCYAALHWPDHYNDGLPAEELRKAARRLCDTSSLVYSYWSFIYSKERDDYVDTIAFDKPSPISISSLLRLTDVLENILDEEYPNNTNDPACAEALMIAGRRGHKEVMKILLDKGIDINIRDSGGRTVLHRIDGDKHTKALQFLFDKRPDVNAQDFNGDTTLHVSSRHSGFAMIKLLLGHGADINIRNNDGNTALHISSRDYNPETADLLLGHGADINIRNNDGDTALHISSRYHNPETADLLLSHGADINIRNNDGDTALHISSQYDRPEITKLLLGHGADINIRNNDGDTALHISSRYLNPETADLLLGHGADINIRNNDGDTALHLSSQVETADLLLGHGADINIRNNDGDTALHISSQYSRSRMTDLLLGHGADINIRNNDGDTALHLSSQVKTADLLLSHGADINIRNNNGCTAFQVALQTGNLTVYLLIEKGADVETRTESSVVPAALELARNRGNYPLMKLLQDKGVEMNDSDQEIMNRGWREGPRWRERHRWNDFLLWQRLAEREDWADTDDRKMKALEQFVATNGDSGWHP